MCLFFWRCYQRVVNWLTIQWYFHRPTKYSIFSRSLIITCDHLWLLSLNRVFSKFSFYNKIEIYQSDCSKVCVTKDWKRMLWDEHYPRSVNLLTFFAIANEHLRSFAITCLKPGLQQNEAHHDDRLDEMQILVYSILLIYLFSAQKLDFRYCHFLRKSPHRSLKKLSVKKLKMKKLKYSFFRGYRCGMWLFPGESV